MKVDQDILSVLDAAKVDGNALILQGQLDRKTYERVMKVIDAAGGVWNRKAKAHLFDGDAGEAIEPILLTGEVRRTKQDFGQFDTPPDIAAQLVAVADLRPGMLIYEPSAGTGNLVEAIIAATGSGAGVFGQEIDPKRHAQCRARHFNAFGAGGLGLGDFLAVEPNPVFDRVVMNPPFARQADITHVEHAARFLKPGGRLAAIMSAGISFRQDKRTAGFRAMVAARDGLIQPLPAGAFRSSGTDVNTVIVAFDA